MSEEEAVAHVLSELDYLYASQPTDPDSAASAPHSTCNTLASSLLERWFVADWGKAQWTRGAYSFSTFNAPHNARALYAAALHGAVFFAGEAANRAGHTAAVHGAMESAAEAVKEMQSVLMNQVCCVGFECCDRQISSFCVLCIVLCCGAEFER
jgi:hypothetical protein